MIEHRPIPACDDATLSAEPLLNEFAQRVRAHAERRARSNKVVITANPAKLPPRYTWDELLRLADDVPARPRSRFECLRDAFSMMHD